MFVLSPRADSGADAAARIFTPGVELPFAGHPVLGTAFVLADPATGSAAGPLALHLARHGRSAYGEQIEIRQGAEIARPSLLYARVEGSEDEITRVAVGGSAVIVAHGEYRLE